MKTYKLLVMLAAFVAASAFAADTKTEEVNEVKQSAASQELAKTGNEFLRFVLTKAERYSGKVEDAIGKGVDVAIEEAPETARQYLAWRFYYHLVKGLIPIMIGFIGLAALMIGIKLGDWIDCNVWCIVAFIGGVVSFICFLATFVSPDGNAGIDHLMSCVQIQVAPRIYIFEELAKIVK